MGHASTQAAPPTLPGCPWHLDRDAQDIPAFRLELAEKLARTCPDERGRGPDFGAPLFACHQSKVGAEVHCAGWLASVGHAHPGVRLAVISGRLEPTQLEPGSGWPALHDSYAEVLDKLRRSATTSGAEGRQES